MNNRVLHTYLLSIFCIVFILLLIVPSNADNVTSVMDSNDSSSQISVAPLNPAFVQYIEELEKQQEKENTTSEITGITTTSEFTGDISVNSLSYDTENPISFSDDWLSNEEFHSTGLIPSPVDFSYLSPVSMEDLLGDDYYSIQLSGIETTDSESIPSRYDLREQNGVTAVKDQGMGGNCWAFGSFSSLESYLLHNRSEIWDFSENNAKNVLSDGYSNGFDTPVNGGGYSLMTVAYFSRWSGPVMESDDPYDDFSGESPENLPVAKHVQDIMILPSFEANDTLYKYLLTHYGAVSVHIYQDLSCFDSNNNSFYYNGSSTDADHSVTLVGWDDDYPAQNFTPNAPGNGAFIIKNSWGDNWGEDGYYYVSYYDSIMGKSWPHSANLLLTSENVSNYDHIYQYDELGWVRSVGYNNNTALGANIFTANSNETLEAISFYAVDSNSFYNISVYRDPDTGPVNSSGPVSVQNGTIAIAGYHTIDLDTNVSLSTGQNFSVVVKFTTPDYNNPIAIEQPMSGYSSNAHAEAGQSYMSLNGSEWEDISASNKNICIKAFTTEEKEPQAAFVAGTKYVHVNEEVDFHDVSLFSPYAWQWNFGDGTNSSDQNTLHSYSDTGVYTVSLNASNSYGSNTSVRTSFIHVLNSTIVVNSTGSADFATIREAVNAASDGDTIVVEPGTYNEHLSLNTDNVSLVSSTGNPEDVRISGDPGDYVVYIRADNITVSNITITGGYVGLSAYLVSGCNISNCHMSENDACGIYIFESQNNVISNCSVSGTIYGLRFRESVNNILNNNSMDNNTYNTWFDSYSNVVGMSNLVGGKPIYYLVNSSDQVINASSNAGVVHLINCSNITVEDLKIETNYYGVYLGDSSNVTISNITSSGNYDGVYLESSYSNIIQNCSISENAYDGVFLESSYNTTIQNCSISGNDCGVELFSSTANTIQNCSISGNAYDGVFLESSYSNIIQNCSISGNDCGVELFSSTANTIQNCSISGNYWGIYLSSSSDNRVHSCNISDSASNGITLTDCRNNLIYNNFFNNSNNAYVSGDDSNYWNTTMAAGTNIINGFYLGGNFWANPTGTGWSQTESSVGNGFCAAYEITDDGNNVDYFPLTENVVQPDSGDSSSGSDNDGVRVKMPTVTSSASNIAAIDSSVRFVGNDGEVEYVFTSGDTPVTGINFESETNKGYVMATVTLLNELPDRSPAPSSVTVYQGMEIVLGDETFSSEIGNAGISFSVSKQWLESNGFDATDIHMEHFSDGIWNRLSTTVTGEDDEYFYFEATTDGFSPFIICVDNANVVVDREVQAENMPDDSDYPSENVDSNSHIGDDSNGKAVMLALLFIVLAGIIGVVYWMKSSGKNS